MQQFSEIKFLDLMVRPALLVNGSRVEHANPAAQNMLGAHIIGQDVRLALRHPDIVTLLLGQPFGQRQD